MGPGRLERYVCIMDTLYEESFNYATTPNTVKSSIRVLADRHSIQLGGRFVEWRLVRHHGSNPICAKPGSKPEARSTHGEVTDEIPYQRR